MKSLRIALAFVVTSIAAMAWGGQAYAQVRLTGKVIDNFGQPIIGATVMVEGTTIGTTTNPDGTYVLANVPGAKSVIVASCIGYTTESETLGNRASIDFVLSEDSEMLEETVVVGYGVQKKSDVTGSISSVKAEEFENRSAASVGHALQGKTSGVQVLQTSGAPGAEVEIRVRGYSSNASSAPLYIVDGLKVNSISYLDTESIESIEILKDAASAAIYGAQAGNGVVLISTKKGMQGEGHVTYSYQHSFMSAAHLPAVMNSAEYTEYMLGAGHVTQSQLDQYWYTFKDGSKADTDWVNEVYGKGNSDRHTLSFQGANDRGRFYVSLAYNKWDGIVTGKQDTQSYLTFQANADYRIKKWLKAGMTANMRYQQVKNVSENNAIRSTVQAAFQMDPITPVIYEDDNLPAFIQGYINNGKADLMFKDPDGHYYGTTKLMESQTYNPYQMLAHTQTTSMNRSINGTFFLEFTPIKGLVYTSRLGYTFSNRYYKTFSPKYWVHEVEQSASINLNTTNSTTFNYQWENFANYSFNIGKNNNFTVMAGMSFDRKTSQSAGGTTDGLTNDAPNYRYLQYSSASANDTLSGIETEAAQIAFFGRLSWSFANRYNVQVNFRADAFDTSYLAKQNRWGYFPSVSAGWTISNEKFFRKVNKEYFSYLKIRASWGTNGNINVLSDYSYSTYLTQSTAGYDFFSDGGTTTITAPATRLANPALKWETSRQVDVGLDARFFRDRLSFNYDFYRKDTEGMLISTVPALISGSSSMFINAGNVLNMGHEFEISWRDKAGDFGYSISTNFSTLKNKVLKAPDGQRLSGTTPGGSQTVTYFEEGYPVWSLFTYQIDHIDAATGEAYFKTKDGEPTANPTPNDQMYSGSGIPTFTYGLTINLDYKNFYLTVFGSGQAGGKIMMAYNRNSFPRGNRLKYFYTNQWSADNPNAKLPKETTANFDNLLCSDAYVFDDSFFRIKQIQFGYNVPSKYLKKIKMSGLKAYVSLDDFVTITKYPGLDPETRSGSTSGLGIDRFSYPTNKRIVLGASITF